MAMALSGFESPTMCPPRSFGFRLRICEISLFPFEIWIVLVVECHWIAGHSRRLNVRKKDLEIYSGFCVQDFVVMDQLMRGKNPTQRLVNKYQALTSGNQTMLMRCLNHARASHEKKRAKGSQGQTCRHLTNKEILLQGNAGKSSLAAFHSLPLHAKPSASIFIPLFPSSRYAALNKQLHSLIPQLRLKDVIHLVNLDKWEAEHPFDIKEGQPLGLSATQVVPHVSKDAEDLSGVPPFTETHDRGGGPSSTCSRFPLPPSRRSCRTGFLPRGPGPGLAVLAR
ncbi:hypothetical protein MUK42_37079 [Musa troglodytarum]|uniref:Uncharacterized protein n=1 Tax=Musa troglodytarum TaxID=320322 RepID=A0A9E7E7W8_9LILI|nr:hypothetical protein MUK42_37079 [Musa troglodytarum]